MGKTIGAELALCKGDYNREKTYKSIEQNQYFRTKIVSECQSVSCCFEKLDFVYSRIDAGFTYGLVTTHHHTS